MNYYETITIFDTEKYKESADTIQNICQEYTGKKYKIKREDLGIKNLAYEIKHHKKGYYVVFHWVGTREQCEQLEIYMRKDDNVLKFITIKIDDSINLEPYEEDEQEQEQKPVDLLDIIYNL